MRLPLRRTTASRIFGGLNRCGWLALPFLAVGRGFLKSDR
jgi:hypothetical protein